MGSLFNLRAPSKVKVVAVPEFKQNGAPMAYYLPPYVTTMTPPITHQSHIIVNSCSRLLLLG
jgi:hypothetical protein